MGTKARYVYELRKQAHSFKTFKFSKRRRETWWWPEEELALESVYLFRNRWREREVGEIREPGQRL